MLKLCSWNVNGLRAVLKKGSFQDFITQVDPDIICLQETKALPEEVSHSLTGYTEVWNPAQKKGYSGTAVFSKVAPMGTNLGIGVAEHDQEGRVVTCEFNKAYLVNVYTPNSKPDLARLGYRSQEWDPLFLGYLKELEKTKPVIFCGDLNVAHQEIDLARPKENQNTNGFTKEERQGFDNIVAAGFIDTFRQFNPDPHHYSWWSYRTNARKRNIGWRIDYFCVSPILKRKLVAAGIEAHIEGSDHCPVTLSISKDALL